MMASEVLNPHRNPNYAQKNNKETDKPSKMNRERNNSSGSLKGSIGANEAAEELSGQRRRNQRATISSSNHIDDRDKNSDDNLTITPKKNPPGE